MSVAVAETLPGLNLERPAKIERPELVAVRGLAVVVNREPNILNPYGIVEPPPIAECPGHEGKDKCFLTRHHLHSTEPDYALEGPLAVEFRDLAVLTVFLPECVHKGHHSKYALHVPIPHTKIMQRARYENGKVKRLVTNYRESKNNESFLKSESLTKKGEKSLLKIRERLLKEKESLLDKVTNLEVLPEQLVTGALLLASPETARRRMESGGGFVLSGVLNRAEIPIAFNTAREILGEI